MRFMKQAAAVVVVTVAAATTVAPVRTAAATGPVCTSPDIPNITGERLCVPHGGAGTVQILVHGATYRGSYWRGLDTFPRLSHERVALARGQAVFTYTREGSVPGDHPNGVTLTLGRAARNLHRIVDTVGSRFDRTVVVGHSLGSSIAVRAAANHEGVDRLVVTGLVNGVVPDAGGAAGAVLRSYPARLDPKFAGTDLVGFITTRPGTRGDLFYTSAADPDVVALDEAVKSVAGDVQFTEMLLQSAAPSLLNLSGRVDVPVLVVVGRRDGLFCAAVFTCSPGNVARHADRFYRDVDTRVVPGTGHNLALHPSAPDTAAMISRWAGR